MRVRLRLQTFKIRWKLSVRSSAGLDGTISHVCECVLQGAGIQFNYAEMRHSHDKIVCAEWCERRRYKSGVRVCPTRRVSCAEMRHGTQQ